MISDMDNETLTKIEKYLDNNNSMSCIEEGMIIIKRPYFAKDSIKGIVMTQDETWLFLDNGKRFVLKC